MQTLIKQNLISSDDFDYENAEEGYYMGIVHGTILVLEYVMYESIGWVAYIDNEWIEVIPSKVSKNSIYIKDGDSK